MKGRMEAFLADLDATLAGPAGDDRLDLYHIGRSALVWKYGFTATTGDIDILRPRGADRLVTLALELFGHGTRKARQHGLYLQVVDEGLPPVPVGYQNRATPADGPWRVVRLFHLEPHDLAATKLRRFWPKDREDLRQMCDLGLLDPDQLGAVLASAFWWTMEKDGDEFRDAAFRHLRVVQQYLRGETAAF